jgi:K+-sensing histidine kinase KdpD
LAAQRIDARAASRWLFWSIALAVITAVLCQERGEIEQSHVVLTFLLVVLGGSSGGRALGYTLAFISFLLLDYYFQPPYDLFSVGKALDWVVLIAFLAAAFVATELLTRARAQAETARLRGEEIAALSAERVRLAEDAQAAHELRQANRAKDEVLATVSHDLRTPITTIKLLAQRAAANGEPTAAAIEEQTDRLAQLVTNVLDLSRIRAGAVALDIQLNTVEDLLGAAIRRAEGVRHSKQIRYQPDFHAPALLGRFDLVQSLRVVGNLIDNALRHSPPDGVVDLEATSDDETIVIRVLDRGPGVIDAERSRIFEAFYRPRSEAPDAGRAGLGLSIARQLADLQQGSLTFEPRSGGGSVFVLRLPAARVSDSSLEDDLLTGEASTV